MLNESLMGRIVNAIELGEEDAKTELKTILDLSDRRSKAEFTKDIAAMANTIGDDGLIIYDYVVGYRPKSKDDLEVQMNQVLSSLLDKAPRISCQVIEYLPAEKQVTVVVIPCQFC